MLIFDQIAPAMGKPTALRAFLGRSLPNWLPGLRTKFAFPADKNLSVLLSKNLVLDVIERAIVLIFFLYFANKMVPRLAVLIVTEIAHPQLAFLPASTNLQATPLVISESP